jgi:hypothetical protein
VSLLMHLLSLSGVNRGSIERTFRCAAIDAAELDALET